MLGEHGGSFCAGISLWKGIEMEEIEWQGRALEITSNRHFPVQNASVRSRCRSTELWFGSESRELFQPLKEFGRGSVKVRLTDNEPNVDRVEAEWSGNSEHALDELSEVRSRCRSTEHSLSSNSIKQFCLSRSSVNRIPKFGQPNSRGLVDRRSIEG